VLLAFGQDFGCKQFGDAEQLEFDGVETAIGRGIDKGQGTAKVLGVIAGDFGNELDHQASTVNAT
jgi:hypothetical protein